MHPLQRPAAGPAQGRALRSHIRSPETGRQWYPRHKPGPPERASPTLKTNMLLQPRTFDATLHYAAWQAAADRVSRDRMRITTARSHTQGFLMPPDQSGLQPMLGSSNINSSTETGPAQHYSGPGNWLRIPTRDDDWLGPVNTCPYQHVTACQ